MSEQSVSQIEFNKSKIFCNGRFKVSLSYIGEGYDGDYDKNNKSDNPLLRFDIEEMIEGEWEAVENTSYCTQLTAFISTDQAQRALDHLAFHLGDCLINGQYKRQCEIISCLSIEDV